MPGTLVCNMQEDNTLLSKTQMTSALQTELRSRWHSFRITLKLKYWGVGQFSGMKESKIQENGHTILHSIKTL